MKDKNTVSPEIDSEIGDVQAAENTEETKNERTKSSKRTKIDIIPMIICLFCAVVIWFYVMQVESPEYEEVFEGVEVQLTNSEYIEKTYDLSVISGYGYKVDITVKGRKSVISEYTADDISVIADLKDITVAETYEIPIKVNLPSGLEFVKSEYNDVEVYVDERVTSTLFLRTNVIGATYSAEYDYGTPTTDIETIQVSGPKRIVDSLSHASVEVDLSSVGVIKETIETSRPVVLVDNENRIVSNPFVKAGFSDVIVTIPVYDYKEVPLRLEYLYGYYNNNTAQISVTPETVTIKGEPKVLEKYDSIVVTNIDEKSIQSNVVTNYKLPVLDGVFYEGVSEAEVSITHTGTTVKTFDVKDIVVINKLEDAVVLDESISVTVRGTFASLETMNADDLTVVIDLKGYDNETEGTITVPATIKIYGRNADSSAYEVGFYGVRVKVGK